MKIVFATNNAHKLSEVSQILGDTYILVTPHDCAITEDIPENEPTLEGNALSKALYIQERTGLDCFADDTGLEVESLGGAPGVHSARYATDGHDFKANMELLLKNMEGQSNRTARFRTVIALILGGEHYFFEGEVRGVITVDERGSDGFGYDPIFRPDGYEQTFAQMPARLKNSISHRARAVAKLAEFFAQHEKL